VKFIDYCNYLEKLENTASRNSKTEVLAQLFNELSAKEVREALYLLDGRICAKYESVEFNFSIKMLLNSIEKLLTDIKDPAANKVKDTYSQMGDIGDLAFEFRKNAKGLQPKENNILVIYKKLQEIAVASGKGSQADKVTLFSDLFSSLSPLEAKYLSRMIVGNLRLGLSEKTIIDGLSWYKVGDKSLKKEIERAMGTRSDIGLISEDVLANDVETLKSKFDSYTILPGVPVASKLVEREKGVEAVFERIPNGFVQPKLDGLRAQVHKWTDTDEVKVKVFSRNFEDITHMFPELVVAAGEIPVESFVIDSEVVGYNFEKDKMLPFQDTIQRKRKHGVDDFSKEIPVRSMVFDVLYYDGLDLTRLPIEERVTKLDQFDNITRNFKKLETSTFDTEEQLLVFFENALSLGLEGVIVKKSNTPYEPGTRNFDWIKLKASSRSELVDTIDAVVMGYYFGTGSRSKFGLGAILIGVYNESEDKYETVAKVGTGITDEQFITIKADLLGITIKDNHLKYLINKLLIPDVFVEPKVVVEIEADELTLSKMHTACINDLKDRGISMRFPRLKVWGRDKNPEQATTTKELLRMYELRKKK
jgi:DNA ligase-1